MKRIFLCALVIFGFSNLGMGEEIFRESFEGIENLESFESSGWVHSQGSAGGEAWGEVHMHSLPDGRNVRGITLQPGVKEDGEPDHAVYYTKSIEPTGGTLVFHALMYPEAGGGFIILSNGGPFNRARASLVFRTEGSIRVYYYGPNLQQQAKELDFVALPAYQNQKWYAVKVEMELRTSADQTARFRVIVNNLTDGVLHGETDWLDMIGNPAQLNEVTIGAVFNAKARQTWAEMYLENLTLDSFKASESRRQPGERLPAVSIPNLLPEEGMSVTTWEAQSMEGVDLSVKAITKQEGPALELVKGGAPGAAWLVSKPFPIPATDSLQFTGLYYAENVPYGSLGEFVLETASSESALQKSPEGILSAQRMGHTGHQNIYNSYDDRWKRKTRQFKIPENHTWGRLLFRMEGNPYHITLAELKLTEIFPETRTSLRLEREPVLSQEETKTRLLARPDSTAKVEQENEGPVLKIDGKPSFPFTHMSDVTSPPRGYIREFADYNIPIHFITLFNVTIKHWTGPQEYHLDKVDEIIWNSVQRDPEGNFIVYLNVFPYPDFHERFPGASSQNHKGEFSISRHKRFAPASYWSLEYQQQVKDLVKTYVEHIRSQPYARSIVGFFIGGGEDGQFYYQAVAGQKTIQDGQSPGDLPLFRQWIRKHYNEDLQALQTAWKQPDITFESITPPPMAEGFSETFLNPATHQSVVDHFQFLNEEVAVFLCDIADIMKSGMKKPVIVGAYYGRGGSFMVYPHFAQNSVMFQRDSIDFMGAQGGYYGWREAGSPGHLNWVYDSLRKHNKIPMQELDFRTWVSEIKNIQHDFQVARFWDLESFTGATARDTGRLLSIGGGIWMMEMTGGWFHDPDIMKSLQNIHTAGQKIYEEGAGFNEAEMVIVSDESAYLHTTEQVSVWNGPQFHSLNLQQRAFHQSGVNFDFLYLQDLLQSKDDHYKCYFFLNTYVHSPELEAFVRELEAKGKTIIWQYAPGYVTQNGLSLEHIQKLTGFTLTKQDRDSSGQRTMFAKLPEEHPAHKLLQNLQNSLAGAGVGTAANRFTIQPGENVTVLANFTQDNKPAIAMQSLPESGATRIYIAPPSALTPQFIANLANYAGVHSYTSPGDSFLFHRKNFAVFHGVQGGEKTFTLPYEANITEMLGSEAKVTEKNSITFQLPPGQTRWFHIQPVQE